MNAVQFVQEAVCQCVQRLSDQRPDMRVGLITFNDQVNTPVSESCLVSRKNRVCTADCVAFNKYTQVTIHGYGNFPSRCLSGAELADCDYLRAVAGMLSTPPPLSQTKDDLQAEVLRSVEKSVQLFICHYRDIIFSFLFFKDYLKVE